MKTLSFMFVCLVTLAQLQAKAASANDHLAALNPNGAKAFCNILNRAQKLPQINTSCIAIIEIEDTAANRASVVNGEFGQVLKTQELRDLSLLWVYSSVTVDQLEVLRFDLRIRKMAPDFSIGSAGGMSSAGGK
jgi:hypothetical protein